MMDTKQQILGNKYYVCDYCECIVEPLEYFWTESYEQHGCPGERTLTILTCPDCGEEVDERYEK